MADEVFLLTQSPDDIVLLKKNQPYELSPMLQAMPEDTGRITHDLIELGREKDLLGALIYLDHPLEFIQEHTPSIVQATLLLLDEVGQGSSASIEYVKNVAQLTIRAHNHIEDPGSAMDVDLWNQVEALEQEILRQLPISSL